MSLNIGALIFISVILYSLSVLCIVGALTIGTWGLAQSLKLLQSSN